MQIVVITPTGVVRIESEDTDTIRSFADFVNTLEVTQIQVFANQAENHLAYIFFDVLSSDEPLPSSSGKFFYELVDGDYFTKSNEDEAIYQKTEKQRYRCAAYVDPDGIWQYHLGQTSFVVGNDVQVQEISSNEASKLTGLTFTEQTFRFSRLMPGDFFKVKSGLFIFKKVNDKLAKAIAFKKNGVWSKAHPDHIEVNPDWIVEASQQTMETAWEVLKNGAELGGSQESVVESESNDSSDGDL